jgi:O-antigen ligase
VSIPRSAKAQAAERNALAQTPPSGSELNTEARHSIPRRCSYFPSILGLLAAGLWWVWPELGLLPLVLVGAALVIRKLTAQVQTFGTPFDGPLLVFVIAAGLGGWLAYSRQAGWDKFWLIVAGVTVYYSLAFMPDELALGPRRIISPLRMLFIIAPVAISIFSLASTDWMRWADKLSWLNPMRLWLTSAGPVFSGYALHPNVTGGILAALFPLQLAALHPVRRSGPRILFALLCLGITAFGLFMSATRGAWLALIIVLSGWALWWASGKIARRWPRLWVQCLRTVLWGAVVVIIVAGAIVMIATMPLRSQSSELGGRLALWRDSLDLALDYPLSGLGLASFEMPYSSYILLVHTGYLTHAHNVLLDIWLGQGLWGLLSFGWLLVVALRTKQSAPRWRHAAFAALGVILLHGLVDDAFYGYDGRGVVLLFTPFALLARPGLVPQGVSQQSAPLGTSRIRPLLTPWGSTAILALTASLVLAVCLPGTRAIVRANLGTLAQTRAELSLYEWPAWPIQDALRRSPEVDLAPAIAHFEAALALDPANVTANRRLGQIELSRGQYDAAQGHLENALARSPWQRATRQFLGESYAINGQTARAAELWRTVDLSQGQLTGRLWWYEHLGETEHRLRLEETRKLVQ